MTITKNSVVSLVYVLKDDSGEILDQSGADAPLEYLHGRGNIIPGLEKALEGKAAGESFSLTVAPEDGYGPYHDQLVAEVPRDRFPEGELEVGTQFEAHEDGGVHVVTVTGIEADKVTLDANHPLAGVTLHFAVTVAGVREASEEELAHGHIHDSCDCGSCGEEGGEGDCSCGGCGG
jgi:FKBP-type peptidyl-prolyl cis-trans isomerase SlyD